MSRLTARFASVLMVAAAGLVAAPFAQAQIAFVSVKSADAGLSDFRFLAPLVGHKDRVKELNDFLDKANGKLDGVETKKPFGLYVNWPAKITDFQSLEFPVLFYLPIGDEKQFLDLLPKFGYKVAREKDGLYKLTLPDDDELFFRFAHGHAHAAPKAAWLEGKLADPATFVSAGGQKSAVVASVRFEHFPKEYKLLVDVAHKELMKEVGSEFDNLLGGSDKHAGESELQYRQRQAGIKQLKEVFKVIKGAFTGLVEQARELTFTLDVDQPANTLVAELKLVPRPDTDLAAFGDYAAKARTQFGYLMNRASVGVHLHLPAMSKNLDGTVFNAEQMRSFSSNFLHPRYRDLMTKYMEVLFSTLAADGLDVGVAVHDLATENDTKVILGLKVQNGRKLEHMLRDFHKNLPTLQKRDIVIDWTHARHLDARIHKLQMPGEFEEVYLAFRDDVVFVSFGRHGLKTTQDALDGFQRATPSPSPMMRVDLASDVFLRFSENLNRLGQSLSRRERDKIKAELTLTGGKDVRLRLEVSAHLLRMFADAD